MSTDLMRVPVGPGSLHVERWGFGDRAVVLLHDLGSCSFLWREVAVRLPLGRITAFAPDLLGHGESDRPIGADVRIAAQAEYLDQALTALRVARAAVVGLGIGSAVALAWAAARPGRVDSLLLLSPPDPQSLRDPLIEALQLGVTKRQLDPTAGQLEAISLLTDWLRLQRVAGGPELDRLAGRFAAPFVGADGLRQLQRLTEAVDDDALREIALDRLTQPVILAAGEHDAEGMTRMTRLAGRLRGAEQRPVAGAGRLIPEDTPGATAALVAECASRGALG